MPPRTSKSFQPFPPYIPIRKPKSRRETQLLYNHIKTVSLFMDSITMLLSKFSKDFPLQIGLDEIIGLLLPIGGDLIGMLLGLYMVYLCTLMGIPWLLVARMIFNLFIDCLLGLVPGVGDILDAVYKANLRNHNILADYIKRNPQSYRIVTDDLNTSPIS